MKSVFTDSRPHSFYCVLRPGSRACFFSRFKGRGELLRVLAVVGSVGSMATEQDGPTANEWQQEQNLSHNKDAPRAIFVTFPDEPSLQQVRFKQPGEARFVKFTALNAHDGDDFATHAEFNFIHAN